MTINWIVEVYKQFLIVILLLFRLSGWCQHIMGPGYVYKMNWKLYLNCDGFGSLFECSRK